MLYTYAAVHVLLDLHIEIDAFYAASLSPNVSFCVFMYAMVCINKPYEHSVWMTIEGSLNDF